MCKLVPIQPVGYFYLYFKFGYDFAGIFKNFEIFLRFLGFSMGFLKKWMKIFWSDLPLENSRNGLNIWQFGEGYSSYETSKLMSGGGVIWHLRTEE